MESSVSMDAAGVPPRPTQSQIEFAPDPPHNWRLNVLLEDIASSIDNTEIQRIKLLFRGPGGLGKATLEKCKTFVDLFDVLRERCFIQRGNIVYLNKILYTLERTDLIEKAVKYCREEGNVVHFFREEIEGAGSTCVKIHVGTDIRNIDMETIDRLRNNVAKIACAPVESVRIASVEPGSSLLVTLMIPEIYVTILQKMLDDETDFWELNAVGVDIVVIGEKRYSLAGIDGAEIVETDQQRKVMNIYEQLEQTRRELLSIEIQAVERKKEEHKLQSALKRNEQIKIEIKRSNEILKRKNTELLACCSLLQRMRLSSPDGKSAMILFRQAMLEANHKSQDMNVVKRIVDANTLVVSSFIRNSNEAERKKKEALLEERRSKETELLHQLLTGSITAEKALHTKFARYTLDVPLGLNETTKISKEVSKHLTDSERKHLMEMYHWEENDLIKACIEQDKSLLLIGLECKETEKTQTITNSDVFIRGLFKEVNRADLENMFIEMLLQYQQQKQNDFIFSAQKTVQMQSVHQSTSIGQTTENEVHQIHANTTATLEVVKEIHSFLLEGPYTGTATEYKSNLLLKSFQFQPSLYPMSFPSVGHYVHQLGRTMKNAFAFSFS